MNINYCYLAEDRRVKGSRDKALMMIAAASCYSSVGVFSFSVEEGTAAFVLCSPEILHPVNI